MSELPVLDPDEQRILGSLLEKQTTVPASYPLSGNALRTACNQTSNRDPVVDLDQETVDRTARALKERGLLRIVWADTGRRTLKYHQTLDEHLGLPADERAILTVLLLRGPQAPGELRTRTERLHGFADRALVEACLRRMAERTQPLVLELDRRPGQQDARWVHLLGPAPEQVGRAATPAVDRDAVLADGAQARDDRVRSAYDTVARAYAEEFSDELPGMHFEIWLLDRVLAHAAGRPVVEVGSGPGQVTAYLAAGGADALGIDLSPAMVAQARTRHPEVAFEVGDLRRLARPAASEGWAAVLAWYSLMHLAASELPAALAALVRPLVPGGWLVVGILTGGEVRHVDEWYGEAIELDFVLHEPADIVELVKAAGLVEVEWYHRGAATWKGEKSPRLYVVGRLPG